MTDPVALFFDAINTRKDVGNAALTDGDWNAAVEAYDEAAEQIKRVVKSSSEYLTILYSNKAQAYINGKEYAIAIAAANAALELDSDHVKSLYRRAVAFEGKGDAKAAIDDLEKLLKVDPDHKNARRELTKLKAPSEPRTKEALVKAKREEEYVEQKINEAAMKSVDAWISPNPNFYTAIAKTLAFSLNLANNTGHKPALGPDNSFKIIFIGCRDNFEGCSDYVEVYDALKKIHYPQMVKMYVTLIGKELYGPGTFELNEEVTMERITGTFDNRFKETLTYQLAVVLNGGFAADLSSWTTAMRYLASSNVPTISTGHSNERRWTLDAVFDEEIIRDYFGASVFQHKTHNPYSLRQSMSFIIMFRGISKMPLLSKELIVRRNQIMYLRTLADESLHHEDNAQLGYIYNCMANSMEEGNFQESVNWSLQELKAYGLKQLETGS